METKDKLKSKSSVGLKIKFVGTTVATTLLIGLSTILFVQNMVSTVHKRELMKRGFSIARSVAQENADRILTGQNLEIDRSLERFEHAEEDVVYIFIVDPEKHILGQTFDDGFPAELLDANVPTPDQKESIRLLDTEKGHIYDFAFSVTEGKAGIVHVGISDNSLRQNIANVISKITIFILLLSGAGAVIIFSLTTFLFAPIEKLTRVVKEIGEGNFERKVDVESRDEVGQLAQTFNQMTDQLKVYTSGLEEKIKERTKELDEKVGALKLASQNMEESKAAMLNLLEDARALEIELKEEKDRATAVVTSMGEGLIVIDKKYKVISVNPQAARLLGVAADNPLNKPITALFSLFKGKAELPFKDSPFVQIFQSAQAEAIVLDLEEDIYFNLVSGRRFPVAMTVTPLKGNGITGAIIVFRDISVLKQLDDSKSSFISVSSHQLRTPLTSMRWFSEMLISGDAGPITEEQKHFVERIYQGTDRMIALVNLLLQIARVEAGRVKIEPVPIDLKVTTQGVLLTLKANFEKKAQIVEIKSEPEPFPIIKMDQEIVWQVIQNLLSNASRYSPEKATIGVNIIKKGNFAQYSVKDSGIGIPKAQQARLFEKFFRAENALKMVPEGSGLGLSLVKMLVEGWGGKIWYETEEGKGSTFFFTVPLSGMKAQVGEVTLAV